jgi:uncharacterized protein with beta-barrel porin domain
MTNIWACPTGIAATGRPAGARFRNALLGTVAAGALSLAFGGPALAGPDACTIDGTGTIETCSGNQSAGISVGAPTVTLNVNNLTTAITPASGTDGIIFSSAGAVTITSNTGAFGITTTGHYASGIYARASGVLNVTSTGNIATAGSVATGIYAKGNAAVTVTSTGNIVTAGFGSAGINALSIAAGDTAVTSTGNIVTTGDFSSGIVATGTGAVTVTSTGNISIQAQTINAYGIAASSIGSGAVTVTSTGNITTAGSKGIYAGSGVGAVTVTSTGNIITAGDGANGILAGTSTGTGPVTVISTGNITTAGNDANAIFAGTGTGTGPVTVISTGNIATTGDVSAGISAYAKTGAVTVTSTGNITTLGQYASGITVVSYGNHGSKGGAVTLTSTGNITVAGNNATGIYAGSRSDGSGTGPITVTIKSGTVSGGSGTGAGVDIVAGSNNTLTNFGTLTALSGLAIRGEKSFKGEIGNNTVNNFGTVIGNVVLGSGSNAFNNMAGGIFNSGATVDLGAGNTLTNAGTLSPGGAGVIQTTALTGNLVQSATGRLLTDINIAGATSDRINVSGTANLAGAVQLQVQNLRLGSWQQTVLSAAGGTTNSGLSLLASPALQAQLVFPNATDVVVKSAGVNFVVAGLGTSQTALGNALNGALQTAGLGSPVFNALLNGPTSLAGYNLALNQLSGETATGTQQATFSAMNMFMGMMLDPFNRGTTPTPGSGVSGYASEGDASAYASDGRKRTPAERDAYAMFTKAPPPIVPFEARWSVWAAGFGGAQSTDGNAAVGSNNTTSSIAGTAVGADYRFSPFTIAGFALAGGGTNFSVAGSGGGRSDLFQAGAFIRHDAGAAYISGALAYGWQDIITNRTVTLAGTDILRAEFNANAFSGRVEGGYRFVAPWVGGIGITPYAAAQFTTFDLPAYAESALAGTNAFALSYGAKSVTDPRSELGFRTDKSFAMQDGVLTLRGRLAWAHDYDTNRAIGATFQSLPGASFVVNGAAQTSDSALVTASVEKKWLNGWSAAATFEGEFSSVTASYAGKGVVRYQW